MNQSSRWLCTVWDPGVDQRPCDSADQAARGNSSPREEGLSVPGSATSWPKLVVSAETLSLF